MEEKRKIVKSYNDVWNLARTFYSIAGGYRLPVPLSFNFMIYAVVIALVLQVVFGSSIPFVYRLLVIPGGLAYIFDKKMLDGKNPYQFIRSIVCYYFIIIFKGSRVNRFKFYKSTPVGFIADIVLRIHQALDEEAYY